MIIYSNMPYHIIPYHINISSKAYSCNKKYRKNTGIIKQFIELKSRNWSSA